MRTKKSSPKHNESDSETEVEKETKRGRYTSPDVYENQDDDFVEIVCVVKPRHERTPEIIDLSSEEISCGKSVLHKEATNPKIPQRLTTIKNPETNKVNTERIE